MKRLIVTADDAGLHPGMTLGIAKAFDQGVVTAVSLVANGRAFDHAVEILQDRPGLDVGVHLTLVGEQPLSPPREIPSLVGSDGAFLPGFQAFAARYALGRVAPEDIETELRRQIERILATGLPVVHLNSHQHLHALPRVFEAALELAAELGIPFVRIPREPALVRRLWRQPFRSAQLAVLHAFGGRARHHLTSGIRGVETVGILDAGHLTRVRLLGSLADAGAVTELVCHPGLDKAALSAEYDWGYDWDEETAALCDPGLPALLHEAGFELTSFSRLVV